MKVIWLSKSDTIQEQTRLTREEIEKNLRDLQSAVEQLNNTLLAAWHKTSDPSIKQHFNRGFRGLSMIKEYAKKIKGILQQTEGEPSDSDYKSIQSLARQAAECRSSVATALSYVGHTAYQQSYDTMSAAIRTLSGGY